LEEILAQRARPRPIEELRAAVKRRFVELTLAYLARDPAAVTELPGARALLETLHRMPSVRVAVATGGWRETAALNESRSRAREIGLAHLRIRS
jgi:hypothetical protein